MPNPLLQVDAAAVGFAAVGVSTGTMISEKALMNPKEICLFYVGIAKACYASTGSKRIACGVTSLVCVTALIPGPHQGPFMAACAAAARGTKKL